MEKVCKKCEQEKKHCEFGVQNSAKDKLRNVCKECRRVESSNYRENNKERKKESSKKWKEKNPEYFKIYYVNNQDKIKQKKKSAYQQNKTKIQAHNNKWKKENPDKVKEYYNNRIKKERRTDPLKRLIFNMRTRIYSVLKNKTNTSFEIIGCSPEFLMLHLENQFTEGMSWDLVGRHIHIDHIIPLSSAKTEEEILKLCHYTNLQPLWAKDNLKKSDKILT